MSSSRQTGTTVIDESDDTLARWQHRVILVIRLVIRADHRSLSAVLWSFNYLTREAGPEPDIELLSLMIDYIDLFPERFHHPKEDQHLFASLRARSLAHRG